MSNNFLAVSTASRYSNYHSDYLTQMCRKGLLTCRQISKVWFISLESLEHYLKKQKKQAGLSKYEIERELVQLTENLSGESSFFIADKNYVDSDTASKISSYNRDYLTQLARSGDIKAKKIGKVWFFEEESLRKHMERQKRSDLRAGQTVDAVAKSARTLAETKEELFSYEAEKQEELLPKLTEREQKVPIRLTRSNSKLQIHHDSINKRVREETQRAVALKTDLSVKSTDEYPDKNSQLSDSANKLGVVPRPSDATYKKLSAEQNTVNTDSNNSSSREKKILNPKRKLKPEKVLQRQALAVYRQLDIDLSEVKTSTSISSYANNSANKIFSIRTNTEKDKRALDIDKHLHQVKPKSNGMSIVTEFILTNLSGLFIFISLLLLLYTNLLIIGVFDIPRRSFSAF